MHPAIASALRQAAVAGDNPSLSISPTNGNRLPYTRERATELAILSLHDTARYC
jgi:hypothetical protein